MLHAHVIMIFVDTLFHSRSTNELFQIIRSLFFFFGDLITKKLHITKSIKYHNKIQRMPLLTNISSNKDTFRCLFYLVYEYKFG